MAEEFGVKGHGLWYINRSGHAAWCVDGVDAGGSMPSGVEGAVFYAMLTYWAKKYEEREAARQTRGARED